MDETPTGRKPKPRAAAFGLCREKWLEHLRARLVGHAHARIADGQAHIVARASVDAAICHRRRDVARGRREREHATIRHRVACIDGQVQQVYSISKVGFGIDEQLVAELGKVTFVPASQGSIPYRSEVVLEIPINTKLISAFNTDIGE